MSRSRWSIVALVIALGSSQAAHAVETLDQLLQQTKNARAAEAELQARREEEFLANRDKQKELVRQAKAEWDATQAKSAALSARFDANELALNDLETKLRSREGNLGELFGVTRQVSGDLASVVHGSLISAQYPGRDEFFTRIAKAKALPSIVDLEQLWFEMLREMTETGRVARFQTQVVLPHGEKQDAEVVRIGGFIAMSDGRYLSFTPGADTLSVLPRQPGSDLVARASALDAAKEGYVEAVVDPSRGVLLALTTQRPGVWERIEKGESIGYVILAVGLVGSICAIYQLVYLIRVRMAVSRQLKAARSTGRRQPARPCARDVQGRSEQTSTRTPRWWNSASRRPCCVSSLPSSDSSRSFASPWLPVRCSDWSEP